MLTLSQTVCVFVLPVAVSCTGCGQTSAQQSSGEQKPIVADGASFSEPAGWVRLKPDKKKTKGWFINSDSDRRSPKAMIMVDTGKAANPNLRETAEKMAADWGGTVLEESTTLDGVEALRVRVSKPGGGLRPVEGVAAIRNGRLYLVMGGTVPGRSIVDEVEEVRTSWKWIKQKPE